MHPCTGTEDLYRLYGPLGGVEVWLYPFMTTALEGGEGSASRPGRILPPGKTRYPLYRRLGGLQGRSGQVRKTSLPPGFDPQTVQPVASRYTDWTTRPLKTTSTSDKLPPKHTSVDVKSVAHNPYFCAIATFVFNCQDFSYRICSYVCDLFPYQV